jgi:alpha-tubulin suppressor-like RCC1 family protein
MADCSAEPVAVVGIDDAAEIVAGGSFTCARRRGGRVSCWGARGAVGDGRIRDADTAEGVSRPVFVAGLGDAVELAAGDHHACARRAGGHVVCWGMDDEGQLGRGENLGGSRFAEGNRSRRPVAVLGLTDAVQVAAGGNATCARRGNGTSVCWGSDSRGQLGDRTTGAGDCSCYYEPRLVQGVRDAIEVRVNHVFGCARQPVGRVVCWGSTAPGVVGIHPDPGSAEEARTLAPVVVPMP